MQSGALRVNSQLKSVAYYYYYYYYYYWAAMLASNVVPI